MGGLLRKNKNMIFFFLVVVNAIDFVLAVTAVYVYTVGQSLNVHSH